jgi:hypothetical protein
MVIGIQKMGFFEYTKNKYSNKTIIIFNQKLFSQFNLFVKKLRTVKLLNLLRIEKYKYNLYFIGIFN